MKFRVYINNSMDGPFGVAELWQLPGFSLDVSVCPDGEFSWQPARQYPVITRFVQQKTSGDYEPGPAATEDSTKITSENWRQAVIGGQVPETKAHTVPTAPPAPPVVRLPVKKPESNLSKIKSILNSGERRKGILLALLGF